MTVFKYLSIVILMIGVFLGSFLFVDYLANSPKSQNSPEQNNTEIYDDPAIAICEHYLKSKKIFNPGQYQRISAEINGSVVTIQYKISSLNIAPKQKVDACYYKLSENMEWNLTIKEHRKLYKCEKFFDSEEYKSSLKKAKAENGLENFRRKFRPALLECKNLADFNLRFMKEIFAIAVDLIFREVYPISANNTALVQK